ncbi:MAG: TRAP transporter substrate-binding protein DctP [Alphaproteobacteria bacterium]
MVIRQMIVGAASGAALMGVSLLAGAASAARVDGPAVQWDMAMYGPPRSVTVLLDQIAKLTDEATDGKFKIKVHYGATLAPEKEVLDGLSIGAFQSGWVVVSYAPGKLTGVTGLDLPFIPVTTLDSVAQVQRAYLALPEIANDYKRWGTVALVPCPIPFYEFMGKGKGLRSVADFKGQRLRVLGGLGESLRLVGAVPANFTSPDLYPSLDRGMLDAAALGYYAFDTWKLPEISTWFSKGLALTPPISTVTLNQKAFDSLPPQYQKLLGEVSLVAAGAQMKVLIEEDDKAEANFLKRGLTRMEFPADERVKLVEAAGKPVHEKWAEDVTAKGYQGRKLLDFILATAKKAGS